MSLSSSFGFAQPRCRMTHAPLFKKCHPASHSPNVAPDTENCTPQGSRRHLRSGDG
jgi:hypothetical protein